MSLCDTGHKPRPVMSLLYDAVVTNYYILNIYRSVPKKHPWALGIHRPKTRGGCLHREAINAYLYKRTAGASKMEVGAYTEMSASSGHYSTTVEPLLKAPLN